MPTKKAKIKIDNRPLILLLLIGDTFHLLRLEKNISIRQVAKAIKMAPYIISKIEKGDKRGIRYLNFIRLCDYYGLTAGEFIHQLRLYATIFKITK